MDKWVIKFEVEYFDIPCNDCGEVIPATDVREKIITLDAGVYSEYHFCDDCVHYGGGHE